MKSVLLTAALLLLRTSAVVAQTAPGYGTTSFSGASTVTFTSGAASPATAANILGSGWDLTGYATTTLILSAQYNTFGAPGPGGSTDRYIRTGRATTAGGMTEARLKANNGARFKLNSIYISFAATVPAQTITLTGYNNGSAVSGATASQSVSTNYDWKLFSVSGNTAFNNIDEMRISATTTGGAVIANFNIDEINIALPVALPLAGLRMQATAARGTNRISWQPIGSEDPGVRYAVERSGDGRSFGQIIEVAGAGAREYSAVDSYPVLPVSYYRVTATEPGGGMQVSTVAVVRRTTSSSIRMAPAPAKQRLTITADGTDLCGVQAIIVDMQGREVHRFRIQAVQTVDVESWPGGLYMLCLPDGSAMRLVKE